MFAPTVGLTNRRKLVLAIKLSASELDPSSYHEKLEHR